MDILGRSALSLRKSIKEKRVSLKEIYEYFLERIDKYNSLLNAFLTVRNDFTKPEREGYGYGVIASIKDNFCTKGIRTTASSKVLENFVPPYDATVVERLKKSGGVIIGKTNLDAWAHGSSTETSDFGPTKNPWDTTRVPGGSSGGSAAAVAAYLSPVSIGSETAGSVRLPAAWCGVVGFKPTYGRISRYGLIAMASSLDCPGILAWHVEDVAFLLEILAGKDKFDATTVEKPVEKYMAELENYPKRMRIGVPKSYLKVVKKEVEKNIERVARIFEKFGWKVEEMDLMDPKYAISVYTIVQRAEVASNLARYDGIRFGFGRDRFGFEAKKRIILGNFVLSHGYYGRYYEKAQKVRRLIILDFKKAFEKYDLLLAPVVPSEPLKLGEFEKYPFFGEAMDVLNEASSVAGLPAISLPSGVDKNNLPLSFQLIGPSFSEKLLLQVGYKFQKETEFFGMREKLLKKYP